MTGDRATDPALTPCAAREAASAAPVGADPAGPSSPDTERGALGAAAHRFPLFG